MAKHYTVTDFIKSSPTFSGLSTLRGLALHRRGAWTGPRSWFCIQWGKWGRRTVNRTSKHAELLQCQALGWGDKSSATCTHSERHYEVSAFDPTVYRWGKWSPERWRNTPRAPRRLTAEPTLLYCAEAWAKWGPEQREGLKSGDRVLYHQGPPTGRRQEYQLAFSWRVNLDPSSPVEYMPLPSLFCFLSSLFPENVAGPT